MIMIRGLFLSTVLALGACSEFQAFTRRQATDKPASGPTADALLGELHATRSMSPEALRQTMESRERQCRRYSGMTDCLGLILLLTVGEQPLRDRERALDLLNEIDPRPDAPGALELTEILRLLLQEEQESGETITELTRQLRQKTLRIDELEDQQRALTTIEQKIQQREQAVESEDGN